MFQILFGFYVILAIGQCMGGSVYKEGQEVPVKCVPKVTGTLVVWFRIKADGPQFLFSSKYKDPKNNIDSNKYKVLPSGDTVHLVIQNFEKKTDSGVYACAAVNSNMLVFGEHTVVNGEPDPTPPPPKIIPAPTKPKPATVTTTQCACKKDSKGVLNCETWILSTLAAGCGLLLLLLVITILYCNRLRTRRCPHHYKRQPRNRPAGHAKLPNNF